MQAVLIATAQNQKLWPLTSTKPSPLVSIGNRPVMEIVLEQLARSGIKQVIICLYQMASDIEVFFGDGSRWGVELEYVLQREDWGSAGALYWAKSLLVSPFIVMPADAIIDLDIQVAIENHQRCRYIASVILHKDCGDSERNISAQGAEYHIDSSHSYPYGSWCSETGVYIFEPQALQYTHRRKQFDISTHLLPAISKAGLPVGAFVMEGYWNALESFRDLHDAQKTLLHSLWQESSSHNTNFLSHYSQLTGKEIRSGVWVGRHNVIHPNVQLIPPVLLADNVRLGKDAVIGPDVVIGANTIISDGVSIHTSTIFENTFVGQLIHIEDRLVDGNLVIDASSSEHIRVSDAFLLDETPSSVPVNSVYRLLDILLASTFLLVTLPLTLALGIFSWVAYGKVFQTELRLKTGADQLSDNQPAIFKLRRFTTRRQDRSVNNFSSWLERLEWNRLPELWNVVAGDIRMVGIKPMAPDEVAEISAILQTDAPQQAARIVDSGFTGLWYLQTDSYSGLDGTVIADAYYAATRTWKEDARILIKTPSAWFKKVKEPGRVKKLARKE